MIAALLVFTWMGLYVGVYAELNCPKLKVFNKNQEIDTASVCYYNYKTPECANFANSLEQFQLPLHFPRWNDSVDAPTNLRVSITDYEYDGWIFPGMAVKFNSPKSAIARSNILGYLVVWLGGGGYLLRCVLFQFHNGSDILKNELSYQYNIDVVRESSRYDVRVFSLPTGTWEEMTNKYMYAQTTVYTPPYRQKTEIPVIQPADWAPDVTYQTSSNGLIMVKFTLPPANLNLTTFDVYLSNISNPFTAVDKKEGFKPGPISGANPQAELSFKVQTSNTYQISIWVADEYYRIEGRCSCWRLENNNKKCQMSCGSRSTPWFEVKVTN